MARHKQPRELAVLKGEAKNHPGRYPETAKHEAPLGDPPDYFDEFQERVWFELVAKCIPEVLTYADSVMLEIATVYLAEMRQKPNDFPSTKAAQLTSILARFGMSPSDRNKLAIPSGPKPDNPYTRLDD